jgi:hypothetical protein
MDWIMYTPNRKMENLSTDVADLLTGGRSGLRAGNIHTLPDSARKKVNPTRRVHSLKSHNGRARVSLDCSKEVDMSSVAGKMVDDLFPMSRAVKESPVSSTCLRLAIEYAKLRIMVGISSWRDVGVEIEVQEGVVDKWRGRCSVQLDMLGMCRSSGVYQMAPEPMKTYQCPFTVQDAYDPSNPTYYVTPGCLVYKFSSDLLSPSWP